MLVSPATLLSLAASVMEVLVEEQISATLWLKLPPGNIWYSPIRRYHEQVRVPNSTYVCHTQKTRLDRLSQQGFPMVPVQIVPRQLKREYFLLVLSPQFSCWISVRRPRMRGQNNNSQIESFISFEEGRIQNMLDRLKGSITQSMGLTSVQPQSQTTNSDLLTNWDSLFMCPPAPNPLLIGQLVAKIVQQLDATRSSTINQRITKLTEEKKELSNSLSRKNDLFSSTCQELSKPVTEMKVILSSLMNPPPLTPQQRRNYLEKLNSNCDRHSKLIKDLLELEQLERSESQAVLKPLPLDKIVPGVVSTYQHRVQEKGIRLYCKVSNDLPPILCSSAWVTQIVLKLLDNSIKFTLADGQIWVKASKQGGYVQLEFSDTGIGISRNDSQRIFDRFYRGHSAFNEDPNAVGLGLTIVKQMLLRCGGSISVQNRLGGGSTFYVRFPIAPSNPQNSRPN